MIYRRNYSLTDSKKKRTRRHFGDEFKREAVALFQSIGVSAAQVGKKLRESESLRYRWAREYSAQQPNLVWVTDITEFPSGESNLYLSVIKDLYDGMVVSWKTQAQPTANLVVSTLEWAVDKSPQPEGIATTLHSDHGSKYTSHAYQKCMQRYGLR